MKIEKRFKNQYSSVWLYIFFYQVCSWLDPKFQLLFRSSFLLVFQLFLLVSLFLLTNFHKIKLSFSFSGTRGGATGSTAAWRTVRARNTVRGALAFACGSQRAIWSPAEVEEKTRQGGSRSRCKFAQTLIGFLLSGSIRCSKKWVE